jgi:hypothetical protein
VLQAHSQPHLLRSSPHLDLQRALLVLTGRVMLRAATQIQQTAAAKSADGFKGLVPLLLGADPANHAANVCRNVADARATGPLGDVVRWAATYGLNALCQPADSGVFASRSVGEPVVSEAASLALRGRALAAAVMRADARLFGEHVLAQDTTAGLL